MQAACRELIGMGRHVRHVLALARRWPGLAPVAAAPPPALLWALPPASVSPTGAVLLLAMRLLPLLHDQPPCNRY
jgi:hypothetical protein